VVFGSYRSLQKIGKIYHPDVIIGSREEVSERARKGPYFYGGWVWLTLTPGHAATIFPWILGADASGTTFALAETLQALGVLVDKVTTTHEFYNGVINRAVIQGRQNGPNGANWIRIGLQLFFRSYAVGTSYPSLTLDVTGQYAPLVYEDGVLTLAGSSREVKAWTIDINNYVEPRWVNNLEATALCPSRRTVRMSAVCPYDSGTSALYDPALAGVSGSLVITNSSTSITFTAGTIQIDTQTPVIEGKRELDLKLDMSLRKSGSTSSLVVSIDSTP
jgi:hypothetical protein